MTPMAPEPCDDSEPQPPTTQADWMRQLAERIAAIEPGGTHTITTNEDYL